MSIKMEAKDIKENYRQGLNNALDKLKSKVDEIIETSCSKDAKCSGVTIQIMIEPCQLIKYKIEYKHYV